MAVAAGFRHTCTVQYDGRLVCFGENADGQCNVPADLGPVMAVATQQCTAPTNFGVPGISSAQASGSFSRDAPFPIDEDVEHAEPPADIAPAEAAEIVAEQHASWISHNIDTMVDQVLEADDSEMEPLLLLQLSRSTEALHNALSNSHELEPVRAALYASGFRPLLPSGATVLAAPAHFNIALLSVAGRVLQPCHVIVTESLESLVLEVVNSLPTREKIRLRRSETVGFVGQTADDEWRVVLVRRTFLEVPRGIVLAPTSVIQSTTEALERRAVNPRRWNVE